MKLITWNVNGIRAVERKGDLQTFLDTHVADLYLLQEIKGNREQFSAFLTEHEEFEQYYHSAQKKGYAGTGIWMRKSFAAECGDISFHTEVPHAPNMDEGRVSHISFVYKNKTYDILSIYFPNGGKSDEAWEQKLVFYDKILDYMNALRGEGHEVIVGGDMNVAHTEIDLTRSKENDGKIGFHPKERSWMDQVIVEGWRDAWRALNPGVEEVYSYWDMVTRARSRNVGWRIDYFFIDDGLLPSIKNTQYLQDQMGSDHCPLMIEITAQK